MNCSSSVASFHSLLLRCPTVSRHPLRSSNCCSRLLARNHPAQEEVVGCGSRCGVMADHSGRRRRRLIPTAVTAVPVFNSDRLSQLLKSNLGDPTDPSPVISRYSFRNPSAKGITSRVIMLYTRNEWILPTILY